MGGKALKALTILEPWASLIACGAKKIETRSWRTNYRGKIAIHAGKKFMHGSIEKFIAIEGWDRYAKMSRPLEQNNMYLEEGVTLGCIVAIADLVDCVQFTHSLLPGRNTILLNGQEVAENEITFGDCTAGRWGWILENIQRIEPVPAKGQQGLWNWEGGQ